jgi:hypothetical protein
VDLATASGESGEQQVAVERRPVVDRRATLRRRVAPVHAPTKAKEDDVSWYEVLRIAPTASEIEITAAYRRRAKQIHPDMAPTADDADRRARAREMARLNQAYRDACADAAARRVVVLYAGPPRLIAAIEPVGFKVLSRDPMPPAPAPDSSDAPTATALRPVPVDESSGRRWGWRITLGAIVTAAAFGLLTVRSSSAPDHPAVDNCVVWTGTYEQAPCDQPHDGRVVMAVNDPARCPSGSAYMPNGRRVLCIELSE